MFAVSAPGLRVGRSADIEVCFYMSSLGSVGYNLFKLSVIFYGISVVPNGFYKRSGSFVGVHSRYVVGGANGQFRQNLSVFARKSNFNAAIHERGWYFHRGNANPVVTDNIRLQINAVRNRRYAACRLSVKVGGCFQRYVVIKIQACRFDFATEVFGFFNVAESRQFVSLRCQP